MPHHRLDRHRDVSVRRRRHADADQECRHGDVSRQGGRQERLPLLHQGNQDAVDRAADAGERLAPRAGARPVHAALSAQDRHGERPDHRRRGAAALEPSRTRQRVAGAVHSAGRGDRADRSDRPLGAQGSLRAEHGLAAPRPAAGDDGGQPFAAAIRRRASVAGYRRGAGGERHVAGAAAARSHRKHGDAQRRRARSRCWTRSRAAAFALRSTISVPAIRRCR